MEKERYKESKRRDIMKIHCFRLKRGQDLLLSIKEYLLEKHIKAGTILSAVGCVSKARIRDASGVTIRELMEPLEIVSLMGTVSESRSHLHVAFSKEDLSTVGGHLVEGCIINTTGEIVIMELEEYSFHGEYDAETGYDELIIK